MSVAPTSIHAASVLQLMSLGLRENLEKGKLLVDGDIVNPEPENFSISKPLTTTIPADKPLIHSEEDHLGLALKG